VEEGPEDDSSLLAEETPLARAAAPEAVKLKWWRKSVKGT